MNAHVEIGLKRAAGLVLLLVGVLIPLAPAWGQPFALIQDEPEGPAYVAAELIVQFKPNTSDADLLDAMNRGQLRLLKHIHTGAMKTVGHPGVSRLSTRLPVRQAIQALQNHPAVEFAEPNWVCTHQAVSNDPYYTSGSLWGMYGNLSSPANVYGSQAAEAWAGGYIGSKSVVVGVIDEGIQITHADLSANIWRNPSETADGLDNDGNGYVDDLYGWDFFEDNSSVFDGVDAHGTHVAGTIGAVGGNSLGVVGVNWSITLISGKFLGPDGGSTTDAVEAVDYFTALKLRGVNIVALNNSWGGSGYSQALHDAIIRAAKANILFVAASGNGNRAGRAVNIDSSPSYPACYNTAVGTSTEPAASYDAVISVTAIDSSGNKASFANYGATTVDLGAPGVGIYSTIPTDSYDDYSGTSMATPHVTGAIALYASTHPQAAAPTIKQAILDATTPTASLAGKTVTGGRLDLSTVINAPPPAAAPTAPSDLAATAQSYSQIKLDWTDNSDNESHFEVTRSVAGAAGTVILLGANSTTYTDSGLSPNTSYSYAIKACNSVGCSSEITALATTPSGPAPSSASFVGTDTGTQGTWIGTYGTEGYDIVKYKSLPSYGIVTPAGFSPYTWADPTSDVRALQTPSSSSRFASCYYSFDTQGAFRFDLNFTDNNPHRVSLYCLDWDRQARQQIIEIVDRTYGVVLDSLFVEVFGEGKYLTWDITGPVIVTVKWVDNNASAGDNAAVSGVFFDPATPIDHPPTVAITSPANGTTVSGPVTIQAEANDDGQVTQVEFFVDDGISIGIDADGADGWSASWTSTTMTDGPHTLTAKATDNAGQTTASASLSVAVDNIDDPPVVAITSPANGTTVSGTVTIFATASDDRGVTQVEFFVDGKWIGTDTDASGGWSMTWDTTSGADGTHSVTAVATDSGNQTTTSLLVSVNVRNTTPTTLHCGDLDGTATTVSKKWRATVTVLMHDGIHQPVSGATVTGTWSGGFSGTATGTTGANGTVSFSSGLMQTSKSSVMFTITGVTAAGLTYNPADNHDPDGDSNGTSITVPKP